MIQGECMVFDKNRRFTGNETNNIIYLCLKYVFGSFIPYYEDPDNADIKEIMLSANEEPTAKNIIDKTLEFVAKNHFHAKLAANRASYSKHMICIIEEFSKQPYDLRNDLGEDSEDEDLITKH